MIPKIKRIRRKKLQTGGPAGTARKFENIPTASQPAQDTGLGARNELLDKFVQEQIKHQNLQVLQHNHIHNKQYNQMNY